MNSTSRLNPNDPQYGAVSNDGYEIVGSTTDYIAAKGSSLLSQTKQSFAELKAWAETGDWTMRLAGCIAGGMIFLISALSITSDLLHLSLFTAILDIYLCGFGLLMLLLEYKEKLFPVHWQQMIRREALFLYQPYGRAVFYIFVGILLIVKGGFSMLCGLYTAGVGIWLYLSWRKANAALEELRQKRLTNAEVAIKFDEFDLNKDGRLDMLEINNLCRSLGHKLTPAELESAFFILDQNGEGVVTLDDFQQWYSHQDI